MIPDNHHTAEIESYKKRTKEAFVALEAVIFERSELERVLRNGGFVKCDIPACNCGSWHQRYGLPERMAELEQMLADAGHPPCNENGNLISHALRELVEERDGLLIKVSP